MKIEFTQTRMKLAHVNVRSEVNGEDRECASDIRFDATVSNDVLNLLDPNLKAALYHYDNGKADVADEGKHAEPGFLPHLRFPKLSPSGGISWEDEMKDANIAVTIPGAKSAIMLEGVKVNKLRIWPKDGGSVMLSFRVQCHPDEKVFGKLATLVQTDVEVSLSPAPVEAA